MDGLAIGGHLILAGFFLACITAMVIYDPSAGNSDAMKVCQIDHSYDVCFQALNR